jgi:alanine racemase
MQGRPTTAHIDLSALAHNLSEVRRCAGGGKILAVVKADAYGHGAVECAMRLVSEGVDMLGVALIEEGAELRAAGINSEILVLGGVFEHQADDLIKYGLTPAVYATVQAEAFSEAAIRAGKTLPVHVKIDTGMSRVGVLPEDSVDFVLLVSKMPGLKVEGLMTHLSDVAEQDKSYAELQVARFDMVVERLQEEGVEIPLAHASGSAAVIDFSDAHFNMVRPGIMLYGCYPSEKMRSLVNLKPVMSLKTKIMHIKKVGPVTPISYGRTFYTKKESLIATLPIGYADGLNRKLSNRGSVLIGGRRCPIVGTVCMDMIMVDVSDVPNAKVYDEAVIIGRQGEEQITAEEVAGLLDTISYEVLCNVSKRVGREYK